MTAPRRGTQLRRVLALMARLRAGSQELGQLARDLGVSTRTVRRDIESIEWAGVPVRKFGTDAGTTWSIREGTAPAEPRTLRTPELPVKSAAECRLCEGCGEPWCAACGMHYADCPHPGPHSEGVR